MKNILLLLLNLALVVHLANAQKSFTIKQTTNIFNIDGELDEDQWNAAERLSDFTVNFPSFGKDSKYDSEVKVVYDNEAIYIGAVLKDHRPDSISYSLSQRDDMGNADWFGFSLDPYANNVTAFTFIVTSAGVELDALEYPSGPDWSWNAVWKSTTVKREDGWSVEIRIPFSAIRFPNKEIQEWNVNFARSVRRDRELSFWNPVDPNVFGDITQSGVMKGIENIKSPLRLSLTPYVTGYLENSYDYTLDRQTWKNRITGGVDLKYGLNDAFTLDMTLIPDFGQTVSDRQVLNLGPFEVRYNENRSFFLEGTDLFQIGNVFYSRRIGGNPFNQNSVYGKIDADKGEEVLSNPNESPLINATKISGRTTSGLGIGIFNAVEGQTFSLYRDSLGIERKHLSNPLTNYNVLVLSQNLKNNSKVSFVNTSVLRNGTARDANVSVFETSLFSKDRAYKIDGSVKFSSLFEDSLPTNGHAFSTTLTKVSGNYGYSLWYSETSDTYDPNDLGFLYNNNQRSYGASIRLNDFDGDKYFLRKWSNFSINYEELYKPQLFSYLNLGWNVAGTMKNFLTWGLNGDVNPFGGIDHFESRVFGRETFNEANFSIGGFYSSDYSKAFALDFRPSYRFYQGTDRNSWSLNVSPRVRLSDRIFLVWGTNFNLIYQDFGYVNQLDDNFSEDIILGVRNRSIIENSLKSEIIFTKRMGVNIQLRHYWQQVEYTRFRELEYEGVMVDSEYNPLDENGNSLHNTNFNAFTLDVNYRWVFFPGSELRVVYKNNIFHAKSDLEEVYFDTFNTLFDQPQINSISMKLLMFIDAIYFRRKDKAQKKELN